MTVVDSPRPPAIAVRLVSVGDDDLRVGFTEHLRSTTLLWPSDAAEADAVHATRSLPRVLADRENALRRRLRQTWEVPATAALAPRLAQVLDQVGRCRRALGADGRWRLQRAQDPGGGSRYELGLGADLARPAAAELDDLARRLRERRIEPAPDDPDPAAIRGLLAAAVPADAAADPDGSWLLAASGLATVHRVDDDTLYVSHVPTSGLTIGGSATGTELSPLTLDARYHAAGEPGSHALLVRGLASAATEWAGLGDAWQVLDADDAAAAWRTAVVTGEPAARLLGAVGMPAVTDPAATATALDALPAELVATLRLHPTTSRRITAGRREAVAELRRLLGVLGGQGLSSALPLVVDDDTVLLVVGGVALPGARLNLAERTATLFRWCASRLWPTEAAPTPVTIGRTGPTTSLTPPAPGLYAVVVLGRVRLDRAGVEPYEFSVDLPPDAVLSLPQYEYLMNLLDHVRPMGTRVDTWTIRRCHVDLDGDDTVDPLTADVSRTFRRYRHQRSRGRIAADPNRR